MKGLTKRQQEIFDYISQYIETHRYSPSFREIMIHFGFSSLGTVYSHLNILKRKGLLSNQKKCSRSLALNEITSIQEVKKEIELPFIGHLASGGSIETFSQNHTLCVPSSMVFAPDKTYILRVLGESLNHEMIHDGDLLLVEARQEAHAGETILAFGRNKELIIKKYFPEGNYARLMGNKEESPLIVKLEELQIHGVLIGLLRLFG